MTQCHMPEERNSELYHCYNLKTLLSLRSFDRYFLRHTQEAGCLVGSQDCYQNMQRWLGKHYGRAAKLNIAHFKGTKGFLLNLGCLKVLVLYYPHTRLKWLQGRIPISRSPPSQWKSKIISPPNHVPMKTYVDMKGNSSTGSVRPAPCCSHLFSCTRNLSSLCWYAYALLCCGSFACPAGE